MTELNWQELAYTLFEEAGDALFLFDPETEQLEDVNPMAQRLSGYTRHELLRTKVTFLFRAEIQGGLQRLRHAFQRTGLFHSQEGFWLRHQKEGLWIPVNLTITRLHTEPRTLGLITARDIREQRDAHEQLKKIEAELRRVTSSVSDCLWSAEVDSTGKWSYVYFSPVVERITGRPADSFTSLERWLSAVAPEDRAGVEKSYARFKAGQPGSIEYRLDWPDGAQHWVRDSVMVTRAMNGKALLLDGVLSDVTENKQAYEALRESEARQRVLLEQMPACLWAVDKDLNITLSVGAGLAAIGVKPGELVGVPLKTYLGTDDPSDPALASHLKALAGESVSYDLDWQGQRGQVYFRSHLEPLRRSDGVITGCIGVCLDITERMRVSRELEKSQRAMATLMSNLPGMAYRCRNDNDWTMEFVSEGTFDLTGYQPADLINNGKIAYADLIHPSDRDMVWREVQSALEEKRPFRLFYRIVLADGSEKWVWEQGRGIEVNGEPLSLEGFITDITERKRFEEALRTSEAKYRSLIENLTQAIFLKDRQLRIVAVNKPFCLSVGKPAQEILGKTDFELFPEVLAEKHRADDRQVLAEGRRIEVEEQRVINGKARTVQVVKSPVRDQRGDNVGVLGIFWDVTEQRTLESQFRQAQKMDAIGQLAGGIAHDFNNLLTAIIGNLEMAQMDVPEDHPSREMLANGLRAGFRAADLTRQLLSFARQTPLRPGPLSLNSSIDETVRMLRRTIDPRIGVEINAGTGVWSVQADAAQMGQVLMNLLLNARDAMPDGGKILFETANIELDAVAAKLHLDGRPGEFVKLSVIDTGTGMSPEVREHLFEPFFTTKGPGKGTGLGMAVVFGIIKQHEGWIECHSQAGKGTRFDIYLPRAASRLAAAAADGDGTIRGGHETILLADDHEMVCRVGREILERLGYQVLTAADGAQALEHYTERHRDIGLVILDLSMPKLSGQEVLQHIRKINPDVKVLISSGYYTDQAVEAVASDGAIGFVGKPYRPEELARSVREALDKVKPDEAG